jgi:dipeptidyl aminopeptidase/acylaminoacyl peptidase
VTRGRVSPAAGVEPGPLGPADLFRLRWIGSPRLDPAETQVACVESWPDQAADRVASKVVVVSIQDGGIWRSNLGIRDRDPAWSPDGARLALVSDSGGQDRVWTVDFPSGVSRPIATAPPSPRWPVWSPDGSLIAVLSGDELWTVGVASGIARCLGPAASAVVPTFSLAGMVAFVRAGNEGDAICVARSYESTARELLRPGGPVRSLAWSPDGSSLAWIGHRHGAVQGRNQHVYSIHLRSRRILDLTASIDRSAGSQIRGDDPRSLDPVDLDWQADGHVHFTVADEGRGMLKWVNQSGQIGSTLSGEEACLGFCHGRRGCVAVVARPDNPGDLVMFEGGRRRTLLSANGWLSGRAAPAEPLTVVSDGLSIQGWMIRSPAAASERLPLLLYLHGGPHTPWGYRFNFDHQRLVASGRALVYLNPRGSQGYGESFSTACIGDWGGVDYRDVIAMLKSALETRRVDPDHVAVMGESYGAYLAAWTISKSQGFRAAICENGLYDLTSAFEESDEKSALTSEFAGDPRMNPRFYQDRSPIHQVGSINCDVLLMHAEDDTNCRISQSEAYHTALQQAGRNVEFVRLPQEGHMVNLIGRPSSRSSRARAIELFLNRHLTRSA